MPLIAFQESILRVRIIEPGFEEYTGLFGAIHFEKGISSDHVGRVDLDRMASNIKIIAYDEKNPDAPRRWVGPAADLVERRDQEAEIVTVKTMEELGITEMPKLAQDPAKSGPNRKLPIQVHTQADLEKVADQDGVQGLRTIGDVLGVKGRSITELMVAIMKAENAIRREYGLPAEAMNDNQSKLKV